MEHTKGKWKCLRPNPSGWVDITNDEYDTIGSTYVQSVEENQANAQRIVDCVNACDGMDNPIEEIEALKAERDAYREQFNNKVIEVNALEKQISEMESYISTFMAKIKHYKITEEETELFNSGWNKILGTNSN